MSLLVRMVRALLPVLASRTEASREAAHRVFPGVVQRRAKWVFIDLGEAALIVPGGIAAARRELRRVLADRYEVGLAAVTDPDLVDQ